MSNIIMLILLGLLACGKSSTKLEPKTSIKIDTSTESVTTYNINENLVTVNATREANNLYQFLRNNYGKKILSGVMTLNSFDEISWLKTNIGKEPAIIGLDLMNSFRAYNWYNNAEPIEDAKKYWDKNGIPIICWHWRDPSRETEEFYTKNTTFDISKIFDETSDEYRAMLKDIDSAALY